MGKKSIKEYFFICHKLGTQNNLNPNRFLNPIIATHTLAQVFFCSKTEFGGRQSIFFLRKEASRCFRSLR